MFTRNGGEASVERPVRAIARGEVAVVDDEDRENEGDLVFAAEHATTEKVAFLLGQGQNVLTRVHSAASLAMWSGPGVVTAGSNVTRPCRRLGPRAVAL